MMYLYASRTFIKSIQQKGHSFDLLFYFCVLITAAMCPQRQY